jgi:hypothetical protein
MVTTGQQKFVLDTDITLQMRPRVDYRLFARNRFLRPGLALMKKMQLAKRALAKRIGGRVQRVRNDKPDTPRFAESRRKRGPPAVLPILSRSLRKECGFKIRVYPRKSAVSAFRSPIFRSRALTRSAMSAIPC